MADEAKRRSTRSGMGRRRPGSPTGRYTKKERDAFGRWVELGAKDPEQQRYLDGSLSRKYERREPSGSEWIEELLWDPVPLLLKERIPDIHPKTRVQTTILHHHRGLRKKVIVMSLTVEEQTGDASIVLDKETPDSY